MFSLVLQICRGYSQESERPSQLCLAAYWFEAVNEHQGATNVLHIPFSDYLKSFS